MQCHTQHYTKHTQSGLAGMEIEIMQWSVRSPDPTPTNHIWDQTELFIRNIHNLLITVTSLREALLQAWRTVTPERKGFLTLSCLLSCLLWRNRCPQQYIVGIVVYCATPWRGAEDTYRPHIFTRPQPAHKVQVDIVVDVDIVIINDRVRSRKRY